MATPHRPVPDIKAVKELPTPPEYFDEAREQKYYTLGGEVLKMKVIKTSDYDSFCILVDSLISYEEAARECIEGKPMVPGREGTMVKNPAHSMKNTAFQIIQPLLVQFGLTPSARSGMGIGQEQESIMGDLIPKL